MFVRAVAVMMKSLIVVTVAARKLFFSLVTQWSNVFALSVRYVKKRMPGEMEYLTHDIIVLKIFSLPNTART